MRIKVIRFIIFGLFIMIVVDLIYVQVIQGKYFNHLSKNNMIRVVPLQGWRGRIYDRNGEVLADNDQSYNVMISTQEMGDKNEIFKFLSNVLKTPEEKLIKEYNRKKTAPFIPVVVAGKITRDEAIMIEENRYRFPGLLIQEGYQRVYPEGENSAHILGHVSKINRKKIEKFKEYGYSPESVVGYAGVEEYYDSYLRGESGGIQIEVNSRGKQVRLLSLKEPSKGQDIVLTVDKGIQESAMAHLEDVTGSIIVMDTSNGEILGMTNAPAYQPEYFVNAKYNRRISTLFSDKRAPLLNRSISGLYPPGSVFKVAVALAGLDSNTIKKQTTYLCDGQYELGNIKFGCTHVHGSQNLVESIAHSCNVYYYYLGLNLGADQMNLYAQTLGLGELTHVDLPFEKKGVIPSRRQGLLSKKRNWYTGDTLNMSIGQGDVLVTPLQMVRMMSIVAREGEDVKPHLIYSIGGYKVEDYVGGRKVKIKKDAFQEVKKGLRATVTDYSGTAHVLDMKEIFVAGKTGTAQTSKDKEHHAWFVGYAKGEKKEIAFCVFLEHGGSSLNACLLAKDFLLDLVHQKKI